MPRGRKLESIADYNRALKNGYGLGCGSEYKPWLRVQDVKSIAPRFEILGRKSKRIHHLLSPIEKELFVLAEFSDSVIDIREQFPILPLNYSQKIANTLNIVHPTHPKTKAPIIMTTDLLLTLKSAHDVSYHAISVKPVEELNDSRVLEKIDIERVCWEQLGVKFSVYTGNGLTKTQSRNIDWATAPFREDSDYFSNEQIHNALSILSLGQSVMGDVCNEIISLNLVFNNDAISLIRFLIANKYITVDLSYDIVESGVLNIVSKLDMQEGERYEAS